MGRKGYFILGFWFVLVSGLTSLAYLPLSFWQTHIQSLTPAAFKVSNLDGHWWHGKADLSVPGLPGNPHLTWSLTSLFKPFTWQLSHSKFHGYGQAEVSLNNIEFWIDGLSLDADTFNNLLQQQGVSALGAPITVDRWYASWNISEKRFDVFRGSASWSQGQIQYSVGRSTQRSSFEAWHLDGLLNTGLPELALRNQANLELGRVRLLPSHELEVSVMPAMIEALGQRWNGSKDYPAFVMIQALP